MIMPNIYALPEILSASDNDYFIVADSSDNFKNKKILKSNINIDSSSGGNSYSLPIASESSLSGIKVGLGLNIDVSGVLSTTADVSISLPISSETSLGTIIVGNELSITEEGVLSANYVNAYNGLYREDNSLAFGGMIVQYPTELDCKNNPFITGNGFNGFVNIIMQQFDGKILAGGNFTTYNGSTSNRITRINTNGSIDTTFISGTGFNGYVNSLYEHSEGSLKI